MMSNKLWRSPQKMITTRCKENLWGCPQPIMKSFSVHYWCLTKKWCPFIGMERRYYWNLRRHEAQRYEQIMPQCWKKSNTHMKIKKRPHLCTLAPFYKHNISISPTKMKEKWTNYALKMPWGSMYGAIMPLWRSNKGNLMGASCGHKGQE